jgi:hypothetical protein
MREGPRDAMFNRRRLLILVVLGVWMLNVALTLRIPTSQPRIYIENAQRIRRGMTEEEVQRILGCAPGTYTKRAIDQAVRLRNGPLMTGKLWATDDTAIEVVFDSNGRVIRTSVETSRLSPPTFWEKLRQFLGF